MKTITKSIITISALSLLLAGCGDAKKDAKSEKKVSTIEEIQKVNGKPARVVKAATVKLTDVRSFSGTIEGSQQTTATAKLGDPIAKVNVRVGSKVRKDQVLAEFVFTGDNTAYQQAQANIAMQEKSLNRLKEVQAKGGVSLQDVEQLETQINVAKMQMETARRATLVLAPSSGTITEVKFKVGEVPGVGGAMFTIANLDKVILKLNVTSSEIGFFKKGAKATIELNGEKLQGEVSLIPLAANPITRFFPVEVTFKNKGQKLLPGMYLTTKIDAREVTGVSVPVEAIVYSNGVNSVWTVDSEGKAKRKIVQLGVQTKTDIQIKDGLSEGDVVMVEGQNRMNDGDKVLIVE
ncbi:RND family efflux transporter, MFP subunit [Fibrobacter sp. UWB16]|uniref:efflux RND transporter periplasmic adaptor subunit n=1 Tax=Fibrobacter sp. UWB16 TaxID=1945874 RepID=UPI000BD08FCF|nr:efflux RND transporter periplasmic adaptor subunit [Fibrobacter sp. UWB16]SOD11743.1 RND family efflux transporter, MFP subunit [Fibrobacter sp. UWB16]